MPKSDTQDQAFGFVEASSHGLWHTATLVLPGTKFILPDSVMSLGMRLDVTPGQYI